MPKIESYIEVNASIEFDCECSICGYDLHREIYVRGIKLEIEPCPNCIGKLQDEIEYLKEILNQ
jgi:hypothetical protein